jgi:hypothetical protein
MTNLNESPQENQGVTGTPEPGLSEPQGINPEDSEITELDTPTIAKDEPTAITLRWPKDGIIVDAERFTDKGQAEVTIWWDNHDFRMLVAKDRIDLLSPHSKRAFLSQVRNANNALRYLHWDWIVRCLAWKVLDTARRTQPVEEVWPDEKSILTPDYLVRPLLYLDHPAIFFGDYASFKSTLALIAAFIVQLPYPDNGLGWELQDTKQSTNVLYLDYEGDKVTFTKRWSAIWNGFKAKAKREGKDADLPEMPCLYQHMETPLANVADSILALVIERKVRLIIVDSLGLAAGGQLNDPEPALLYSGALRRFGITSISIAHPSKDPLLKQKSVFGSVFFSNLARSIWICKVEGEREPGDTEAIVSMKQIKASYSEIHGALGYQFQFTDKLIEAKQTGLEGTKLASELSIGRQIEYALREGNLTANAIAEAIGKDVRTVQVTLNRMKGKRVYNLADHTWGLAHHE